MNGLGLLLMIGVYVGLFCAVECLRWRKSDQRRRYERLRQRGLA